ncbi:hypothetical protein AVEN_46773-1 [Araneus ventricosus]|uniref:Uncharacterized protein n=1 Tax=Araneus ventricosus TaxID=182803 RepID=A0A4Y2WIZ6_ARAVE|nr:hypothetical protein AVEN_46773-1 [Araneus ventricosus]
MEYSRILKRISFSNRDIEKRVAFSGIIDLSPKWSPRSGIPKWPLRVTPCLPLQDSHPNYKPSEVGKQHYIFVTIQKRNVIKHSSYCCKSLTVGVWCKQPNTQDNGE